MAFLPVATAVLGVASAAITGLSAVQQSQYQAAVAKSNKNIAEENSRRSIERSQIEQEDQDAQARALLGQQAAEQSASGLSLTGKTAMLTRKSAAQLARRDALNIRQGGEIESYNYKVQAANYGMEAKAAKSQASMALLGTFVNMASAGLGAFGKGASTGVSGGGGSNSSLVGSSSSLLGGSKYFQSLNNPYRRAY